MWIVISHALPPGLFAWTRWHWNLSGAAFTRFQTLRLQQVFPNVLSEQLISYGSCQFPTLGFVVERFKQLQQFVPEPFWKLKGLSIKLLLLFMRSWSISYPPWSGGDIVLNVSVCPSVCLSVRLSHPWRGSLDHVCGHTNHRTTIIHAFLESQIDLDVHPRIRFSIFEKYSSELASKSALYGYVMLTKGSIGLRLRANYSPYSNDLYIFGRLNRPRCASREAFCSFRPNSSKLTSPK